MMVMCVKKLPRTGKGSLQRSKVNNPQSQLMRIVLVPVSQNRNTYSGGWAKELRKVLPQ